MSSSKKPRLLVFIVQYPNFSETYMQEEMRCLQEKYDIHVITYVKSPFPRREHFDYTLIEYKLPCFVYYPHDQVDWSLSKPESVKFLEEIGKVIDDFKPDILHGHYFGMTVLLERLAETYNLPFSVRTHSMDVLREPAEKLEKLCALSNSAWCTGILALPYFRKRLLDHGLAETKLIDCWPLINYARFYKPEKRKPSGKILCAGPSSPKKAHSDFIDLALKMKESGSALEFNLYTDGYTLQNTVDYNELKGKPVNIRYADPDDMPEIVAAHDWLIYPADPKINRVGFPVGLIEAQASGLGILLQELPERREEQLRNLGGAGMLYQSIDEIPQIISHPYPEEMRLKGFERAQMCDALKQSHLLTDTWEKFNQRCETIERPSDLVSIVISYYEKGNDICSSIRSALDQSYKNVEVIVVDDASSEFPAEEVIDKSLIEQIKLVTHDTNRGVSASRNTAVQSSKGTYIVPLDADDMLHKDFVLRCLRAAKAGEFDAVYTQMQWFGDSDYLMSPKANLINLLCHKEGFPTLLYKREVFDECGGYREDMPVGSDHQFLLSVASRGFSLVRIEAPLWYYRKTNTGLASIDVEKRMSNLIARNLAVFEENWASVLARLDAYYLEIFLEYHRANSEHKTQFAALHALHESTKTQASEQLTAISRQYNHVHTQYRLVLEENERFRAIHEEYIRVLSAYERLVADSEQLGRQNRLQSAIIEDLKKNLDLSLTTARSASFKNAIKGTMRDMMARLLIMETDSDESKIRDCGIFDENFYRRQCSRNGIVIADAIKHFATEGWKLPINPSPLFDIPFYQKQLQLRRCEFSGNPLLHYLERGAQEGIATSPFFDSHWYLSHYSDVKKSGQNPLAHYIAFGATEARHATDPCVGHKKETSALQNEAAVRSDEQKPSQNSGIAQENTYDLILGLHEASRTGAPLVGQALARGLKKRGLNPLLVTAKGGPLLPELKQDFDLIDLSESVDPLANLGDILTELELAGRLTSNTAILNSAELHPLQRFFKDRGMHVVTLIHEFLSLYPQYIRENLRTNSDVTIFSCEQVKGEALSLCPGAWPNCKIISQGLIDTEFGKRYSRKEARQILARATGAEENDFVILACATADTRKGIDLFVQVASNVLAIHKQARFVWIGGAHNGVSEPLAWAMKDAQRAGISDRLHFLESMDNIEPFFTAVDLFVLPSRLDPLPCVVHQAMASARPVVAFAGSGGVEEMLVDGGGKLVPYLDIVAMSKAIIEFLENPSFCAKEGKIAAQIVSERYDFEKYSDQLFDLVKVAHHETASKKIPELSKL